MMGPGVIRKMNQEAAEAAAQEGMEPYVYWDLSEARQGAPFPWFVDTSGYGADDEPALSQRQLTARIVETIETKTEGTQVGFALVELGQFQGYLGVFRRDRKQS